jgi:hypothetical protein
LEQIKNGVIRVYVYLENQSDIEQIEALKPIKPSYDRGRGEFIGSTDKTKNASADEQRKEARRDYRNIIKTLGVSAALEGHDFAVDWEVLLDAWRKRLRDAEPQIQPPLKGLKKGSHPQRISQGVTSTNLKQVDSDEHFVRTTIDEMKSAGVDPATPARPATRAKPAQPAQPARDRFEYNMHLFRDAHAYPGMLASELTGTPAEIAEKVKARIKDNLRWFWNKATAAQQGGRKWYRGAHNLAKAWAKEFDLDLASVVGTLAALSPQKDWDTNIYLARQAIRIFKTKQDFLWSKEMEKTARRIWRDAKTGKPRTEVLVALRGTRLSDLHDAKQIGDWIRTYEETYGDPDQPLVDGSTYEHQHGYRIYNPDGTFGDYVRNVSTGGKPGQLSKAAWNTRSANESAIMALTSQGDRRLISQAMGEVHKVRQFYNDILDPEHHDGKYDDDVVIDTHAIGAAWVRPLSGTGSAAVAHGLATSPDPKKMHRVPNFRPALDDPKRGQYGLYPVYAEAYRELAKELSKELGVTILPHQVQAVVWTVKRDLFEDISDSAVVRINRAWDVFHRGKRSLGATRELVWQIAELNNAAARRKKRSE